MIAWNDLSIRAKRIALLGGAFSALTTAIFSLTQVMTATESYHPATHGYVRDEIAKSVDQQSERYKVVDQRQIEGQMDTLEIRRAMIEKEDFDLEMTLRSQTNLPDQVRAPLELRRRALAEDKKNIDYKFDQLQRARSGRRP